MLARGTEPFRARGLDVSVPVDDRPFFFHNIAVFGGRLPADADSFLNNTRAVIVLRRLMEIISVLAVAWPDGHVEEFEGRVDGTLVWPPRGEKGFGYDPMFLPDGFDLTFGEMSREQKHGLPPEGQGLSHRARAFLKLAEACLARR